MVAGFGTGPGGESSVFVAVVAVASVVPVSLLVSMARRVATRTVDCCLEQCAMRRWCAVRRWEPKEV